MITFNYLNRNEASNILGTPDEYSQNLNHFSLMLLNCRTPQDFLNRARTVVQEFNQNEMNTINQEIQEINNALENLGLNIDLEISLIKSSGMESMGMPYTRHNSVVLTAPYLQAKNMGMRIPNVNMGMGLLAHEIFHIISRTYPQIRNELYALWNFYYEPINPPVQNLVNPDAPNCNYKVNVNFNGEEIGVTPMLVVQGNPSPMSMMNADKNLYHNGRLIPRDRTNYMEATNSPVQMSSYHPEEISAEAFRLLIEGQAFDKREELLDVLRTYFGEN